ncbi:hypothetical protein CS063_09000 [Sporanaerobium hydrogeniformans]|uniref:Uncharacterized protein n=1 Tax=Sporanaerobium hydrogeniformans TaxID=3072179 RepID=A0AC61DBM4_9FIRM|nr:tyrosine-type recombinase/integrase [Sporanaerobium hydrogeniformans]PHV70659.1 hypothetical protein CS063_09000 [Sporanaerobium hydrogeniformans]
MIVSLSEERKETMLIDEAIVYFITSLETQQLSIHSIRAYSQDLNQWRAYLDAQMTLDQLSFKDFQTYFIHINTLKPSSLKRKRVVLRRFLEFCYKKRLCKERLHEYIDPIKSKKSNAPKEILSKEEIHTLWAYLEKEIETKAHTLTTSYEQFNYYYACRNKLLVALLLYTGARASEIVGLKKQDLQLKTGQITLLAKGHKYNPIPIHSSLKEAFNQYMQQLEVLQDQEIHRLLLSDYLFPSRLHPKKPITTRTLHDLMNKLSNILGRHIHAHLFRHTFASYCIAAHMDISTISSLISHSNPSITLSIYTHEIDAHNKEEQLKKLPSFTE